MALGANEAGLSYDERKRRHVSDLTGGSVWEVNAVCAVASAGVLFWSALQSRYNLVDASSPLKLTIDFLLNIGAILAATTVYANSLGLLLGLLTVPPIIILLTSQRPSTPSSKTSSSRNRIPKINSSGSSALASSNARTTAPTDFPIRPYLTAYRAGMMITTAICILAVDFHVFPRRFAKVETYGTSLMDVGVGSFVFSGGIVAAKPYLKTRLALAAKARDTLQPSQQRAGKGTRTEDASGAVKEKEALLRSSNSARGKMSVAGGLGLVFRRLIAALRTSFPLLALGMIRLWSVKGLEYVEHETEYGVHWNFFFTLGCLPLAMALLDPILASLPLHVPGHMLLGLGITLLHGLSLEIDATGFRAWALTAPRVDLLTANREGITSFPGYLAIFLLGVETGGALLPREGIAGFGSLLSSSSSSSSRSSSSSPPSSNRRKTLILLAATSAAYALLAYLLVQPTWLARTFGLTKLSNPISRRLANSPYVLWIVAFNHFQILLYALAETVVFPSVHNAAAATSVGAAAEEERREADRATSSVLDAYNAGGLALFLLANLATGAVNLGVNTLDVGDGVAFGVLVVYMLACTVVALGLKRSGLKLKL